MKTAILALAAFGVLSGCNDPGLTGARGITEATAAEVVGCTLITNIRMAPGVYGPVLAQTGLAYARNSVKAEAKDAGATHVVFDLIEPGVPVYEVRAGAWRCPS
ncbi:hypothetical protein [Phaeovulum sp.]|uniref:hypothetical protein n=1 Tax=Phaeovulum sp. TaxID=2934796 RepID=UPI003567D601